MENPRAASTLQEAAQWLTARTGAQWDSGLVLNFVLKTILRSVLDRQERDVFLWVLPPARTEYGFRRFDIDTALVKVTRLDPLDLAPLPLTEYESVLALVAGGSIPLPVRPIGEPWQGEDELVIFAKEVPLISADAVRIWACDLVRLAERFESQNTAPTTAPEPPAPPVVAVGAPGGGGWTLTKPKRFQGYGKPLHDLLRAAHIAGQPCPTARDVLDTWRDKRPPEVIEVMADGLKYYDAKGDAKPVDLNAIRKAIGRMTR